MSSNLSTHLQLEGSLITTSVTTLQNVGDLGRRFPVRNHSLTVGAGVITDKNVKWFQLVKRDSADALTMAIGHPVYWMERTTAANQFVFTSDVSASGGIGQVAGVALGASPAAGKYGFIQVGGLGPVLLKGSPTVAASITGLPTIGTTTDAEGDTVSTVTAAILGFCLTAKDATVGGGAIGTHMVMAHLCPPINE